ncbi:MAG: GNAT family N-acetyltransferase [Alphaproteobacteria bacterium]|nr:GNAT family N-acetyltransferase [Alphaproteobacteria bacterium]
MAEVCGDVGAYPFQCRDHLQIWLDTIGQESAATPFFVEVRRHDRTAMLVPLGVAPRGNVRVLTFLDAGVCDYNAPIVFPPAAGIDHASMKALWKSIRRAAPPHDVACLEKIPERAASHANPFWLLGRQSWSSGGHVIALGEAKLEKKRDVSDSNRQRRRLASLGELRFCIASEPHDIARVFEVFVAQKSRRYQETLGNPGFDVPGQREYYRRLGCELASRGSQLSYLTVGDEVIATAWCLIAGRTFYYMMCAYAAEWRKYSPGRLLLEELVRWAEQTGLEFFDLGIGDESYKRHWRQADVKLTSALHPATAKGHAYVVALQLREALRTRLPPSLLAVLKAALRKPGRADDAISLRPAV